jgi:hypothetical protein
MLLMVHASASIGVTKGISLEINVFGAYVAPISAMMVATWLTPIGVRRVATHFGLPPSHVSLSSLHQRREISWTSQYPQSRLSARLPRQPLAKCEVWEVWLQSCSRAGWL